MKKLQILLIVLGISAVVFSYCTQSKEAETHHDASDSIPNHVDTVAITVDDTTLFKFDFMVANIPSPASLIQAIKRLGATYDKTVLNDSHKAVGLPSELQKSLNLGIYNIDLAYAAVNNVGSDVLEFTKAVMILGDGLGLRNTIQTIIGKRAENNLGNQDSLFKMIDDISVRSDQYLRNNHRVYVATLIFAGSWIETLHLNSKFYERLNDETRKQNARKLLWEQRFHLANILNLLREHKGISEYQDLINELSAIHVLIAKVKSAEEMDQKIFKEISDKIEQLRNRISN